MLGSLHREEISFPRWLSGTQLSQCFCLFNGFPKVLLVHQEHIPPLLRIKSFSITYPLKVLDPFLSASHKVF